MSLDTPGKSSSHGEPIATSYLAGRKVYEYANGIFLFAKPVLSVNVTVAPSTPPSKSSGS